MANRASLFPKSLFVFAVCALQPVFGAEGAGAAPAAGDAVKTVAATAAKTEAAPTQVATKQVAKQVSAEASTAAASNAATVFPKISPRFNKWQLDTIAAHGRKNNWKPLPADSVRLVPYGNVANQVDTGFEVNLKTGDVTVLSGQGDVPKIRSFKLHSAELEDLKKVLGSKQYRDITEESSPGTQEGRSVLVESDWQGQYRWRLHWVDVPQPMQEISALLDKAYKREH